MLARASPNFSAGIRGVGSGSELKKAIKAGHEAGGSNDGRRR